MASCRITDYPTSENAANFTEADFWDLKRTEANRRQ
jgi:hypothetical protein